MIVVLAILAATRAFPLGLLSPPILSLDRLQARDSSCHDPNGRRSLTDIIRSCVLTILLCTWVSMHPNIPSPNERWPRIAVRRLGLMLLSLCMPEAVIAWALRQRQLAVELAEKHKGEGWSIAHGFFASMGGFMEYEGNRPIRVLLPDQLESYSLTGNGDFPRISKAEIEDKSKGDAISKGFAILQTGWFVTQCIARGAQGLPVTELELVTVAFATLNLVIYILWWDKPLNVHRGVRVYKKRMTESPIDDGSVESAVGFWSALRDALPDVPAAVVRGPLFAYDIPWLARILVWPLFKPMLVMFGDEDESEERVGTFYPAKWLTTTQRLSFFLMIAITLTFGGIHCIGWSFTFPSSAERTLWRVASLSITCVPILINPLPNTVDRVLHKYQNHGRYSIITGALLLSLYVLSRLALLVLSFLCLRSLPPAAFHVVHWTSFIPHVYFTCYDYHYVHHNATIP